MTARNGSEPPRELDVVEVTADGLDIPRGTQGTVVDDLGDGNLVIEIVRADGSTAGLPVLPATSVRVVWSFSDHRRDQAGDAATRQDSETVAASDKTRPRG